MTNFFCENGLSYRKTLEYNVCKKYMNQQFKNIAKFFFNYSLYGGIELVLQFSIAKNVVSSNIFYRKT